MSALSPRTREGHVVILRSLRDYLLDFADYMRDHDQGLSDRAFLFAEELAVVANTYEAEETRIP